MRSPTRPKLATGVLDPDDEDRTFVRQVMGAVAELDRAKTLRRLNAGRTAKRKRDGWAGGMVPYGYHTGKDGDRKVLVSDDAEQRVIRDAARMRSNGKSWRAVCAFMNGRDERCPHPPTASRPRVVSDVRQAHRGACVMTGTSHETWRAGPGPSRVAHLLRFARWVGGPGGHAEDLGTGAWNRDGSPDYIPPDMRRILAPDNPDMRTWTLDAIRRRFRPNRTAVAYGDPYIIQTTAVGGIAMSYREDLPDELFDPPGTDHPDVAAMVRRQVTSGLADGLIYIHVPGQGGSYFTSDADANAAIQSALDHMARREELRAERRCPRASFAPGLVVSLVQE